MKEYLQRNPFLAFLLTGALSLCAAPAALANEGDYFIEYKGSAEKLVTVNDDLFAHFPELLPGDVVSGSVAILNSGEEPQEVFFYTEPTPSSGNEKADELLYLLNLTITSKNTGETLYDGVIHADELNDPISLGTFKPGEGDTLLFTVSVPLSLDEEYLALGNEVHWVFAVEDNTTGKTIGQTGDDFKKIASLLLLTSIASATVLIVMKKRDNAEEGA